MKLPFDVRPTDTFKISWQKLSYEFGPQSAELDRHVVAAVAPLWREGPGLGELEEDAKYTVPVMGVIELLYEWTTDRDLQGNAIFDHSDLPLLRRKK